MKCIYCNSVRTQKNGNSNGRQRYKCLECNKNFIYGTYDNKFITHFGVKLKATDRNKLTRENYCVPTNEICYDNRKRLKSRLSRGDYKIPNDIYLDEHTFTDTFVKRHYKDCMYNFDLNMEFFKNLDKTEFNKYLTRFTKKYKFKETESLEKLKNKSGLYIMVLDEYNQVYIGITENNIKTRIIQHWNHKMPFDLLIFGTKDKSRLSIDSFGALDTTRIFYKERKWRENLSEVERQFESEIKDEYKLNRTLGGINGESNSSIRKLLLTHVNKRNLTKSYQL